jgi:hypothetical protein
VPFILPLHESSGAEGIEFHCANGSPSKEFSAKNASSSACEQCQLIHLTIPEVATAAPTAPAAVPELWMILAADVPPAAVAME